MSDYEQAVFVSYAWGGDREEIVNQMDSALQKRGFKIIRDKRDLGYKGSISEFMKRIGRGSCVIVVISDKYLRSPNCMFELVEFADGKQFHDRIFPVVLDDANIYDPIKRIEYIKYWELKRNELAEAMKTLDPANLQGIREDIDQYDRIRDRISGLTSILKDMNTLTPEMHQLSDFNDLYNAIERKMKSDPALLSSNAAEDNSSISADTSAVNNGNLAASPATQLTIQKNKPRPTEYICYLAGDRLASLFDQVDTQTLANPQLQQQATMLLPLGDQAGSPDVLRRRKIAVSHLFVVLSYLEKNTRIGDLNAIVNAKGTLDCEWYAVDASFRADEWESNVSSVYLTGHIEEYSLRLSCSKDNFTGLDREGDIYIPNSVNRFLFTGEAELRLHGLIRLAASKPAEKVLLGSALYLVLSKDLGNL